MFNCSKIHTSKSVSLIHLRLRNEKSAESNCCRADHVWEAFRHDVCVTNLHAAGSVTHCLHESPTEFSTANSNSSDSFTYMWLHAQCNNSPLHKSPWARDRWREGCLLALAHSLLPLKTAVISFNPLEPSSLSRSWSRGQREKKRSDYKGRGATKEVWLTNLILFPHTDAVQIDLHTAQCPFSLGVAAARAMACTRPATL